MMMAFSCCGSAYQATGSCSKQAPLTHRFSIRILFLVLDLGRPFPRGVGQCIYVIDSRAKVRKVEFSHSFCHIAVVWWPGRRRSIRARAPTKRTMWGGRAKRAVWMDQSGSSSACAVKKIVVAHEPARGAVGSALEAIRSAIMSPTIGKRSDAASTKDPDYADCIDLIMGMYGNMNGVADLVLDRTFAFAAVRHSFQNRRSLARSLAHWPTTLGSRSAFANTPGSLHSIFLHG
jgi:hypothetical protein